MAATNARIGWIGIGRMGYAMAERLAKAGADLTVWNRTRSKAEPLAARGAKIAASLSELASCDVVFCMVSAWDDVKEVVAGSNGLLSDRARAPKLFIECSSISLEGSAELRTMLATRSVEYLAAPVSGNAKVIKAGRLSFVCSGPKSAFDTALPYLKMIAPAEKAGVPRHAFLDFINQSVMGSTFSRYKTPAFVNLDFKVTFTPHLLRKDLDLGLDAGRRFEVPMPLASLTRDIVQTLIGRGMSEEDFAQLLLLEAEASGVKLMPEKVAVSDGL